MKFADLMPKRTDRALFVGMTGSGKTTLAKYILANKRNVLIYDFKGNIDWTGYKRYTNLRRLIWANPARAIYAPSLHELDNADLHDRFFKFAYLRTNTCVYVDEVFAVTHGQDLPFYYKGCLTRGREKGVEVYSATQRPKDIPQVILSESEHYYVFKLRLEQDRLKIKTITGLSDDSQNGLSKTEFYYLNLDFTSNKLRLKGIV